MNLDEKLSEILSKLVTVYPPKNENDELKITWDFDQAITELTILIKRNEFESRIDELEYLLKGLYIETASDFAKRAKERIKELKLIRRALNERTRSISI